MSEQIREPDNADWPKSGWAEFGPVCVRTRDLRISSFAMTLFEPDQAQHFIDHLTAALAWARREEMKKGAKP